MRCPECKQPGMKVASLGERDRVDVFRCDNPQCSTAEFDTAGQVISRKIVEGES